MRLSEQCQRFRDGEKGFIAGCQWVASLVFLDLVLQEIVDGTKRVGIQRDDSDEPARTGLLERRRRSAVVLRRQVGPGLLRR